jgi:Protein of unknown function (DUF3435)
MNVIRWLIFRAISLLWRFTTRFFAAQFRGVKDIYQAIIPSHKAGMQLKIRKDKLDLPIFRQPERSVNGYRTSAKTPLKASTWSRYLKRLGQVAGFKYMYTNRASPSEPFGACYPDCSSRSVTISTSFFIDTSIISAVRSSSRLNNLVKGSRFLSPTVAP